MLTNFNIPSVVVTRTVTGGQIPKTSTPLYALFLIGAALMLVGAAGSVMNKANRSWGKLFLAFLCLGFGIGCISSAMLSLWAQSYYSANAVSSYSVGYTAESIKAGFSDRRFMLEQKQIYQKKGRP